MLLQKTGWRIQQLVSYRKRHSLEDIKDELEEDINLDKKLSIAPKRLSWLSSKPSTELTSLRQGSSAAAAKGRPLPTKDEAAYSSASSLCSCDCETNLDPAKYSLSKPANRLNFSDVLYYSPPTATNSREDSKTSGLIFSEPTSLSQSLSLSNSGTGKLSTEVGNSPNFDLLEALARPIDKSKTPTQSIRTIEDPEMDTLSDDVDQLIRETDEAFKAVGSALADAKAATQGWYDTVETTSIRRTPTMPRGISKNNFRSHLSPTKYSLPRSVLSNGQGKRKKNVQRKKTDNSSRTPHKVPPPPANTPSRWTLTEVTTNMVDACGKMFRTEVDEMLTPGRMQLIRGTKVENERRQSSESAGSFDTSASDTPTEPFHLESFSSRLDAVRLEPAVSPSLVSSTKTQGAEARSSKNPKVTFSEILGEPTAFDDMLINDLKFPTPPARSQKSRSTSRILPLLPTIPEVSPLLTPPSYRSQAARFKVQQTETHVDLPSTAFTLTAPLFLQGNIRLQRKVSHQRGRVHSWDIKSKRDSILNEGGEALDWTAFQIAILGTMDEYSDDQGHYEDPDPDDELSVQEMDNNVEDLMTWWAGFGIGSMGGMVGPIMDDGNKDSQPGRRHDNLFEGHNNSGTNMKAEIQEDQNRRKIHEEACTKPVEGPELDNRPQTTRRRPSLQLPKLDTNQTISQGTSRLPPSPVFNLVIMNGRLGDKEADAALMGFNLGHDLGNFLNWEATHVQQSLGFKDRL
jgi:hypothetical protein